MSALGGSPPQRADVRAAFKGSCAGSAPRGSRCSPRATRPAGRRCGAPVCGPKDRACVSLTLGCALGSGSRRLPAAGSRPGRRTARRRTRGCRGRSGARSARHLAPVGHAAPVGHEKVGTPPLEAIASKATARPRELCRRGSRRGFRRRVRSGVEVPNHRRRRQGGDDRGGTGGVEDGDRGVLLRFVVGGGGGELQGYAKATGLTSSPPDLATAHCRQRRGRVQRVGPGRHHSRKRRGGGGFDDSAEFSLADGPRGGSSNVLRGGGAGSADGVAREKPRGGEERGDRVQRQAPPGAARVLPRAALAAHPRPRRSATRAPAMGGAGRTSGSTPRATAADGAPRARRPRASPADEREKATRAVTSAAARLVRRRRWDRTAASPPTWPTETLSGSADPAARSEPEVARGGRSLLAQAHASRRSSLTTAPRFSPPRCGGVGARTRASILPRAIGAVPGRRRGARCPRSSRRASRNSPTRARPPRRSRSARRHRLPGGGSDSCSDCATSEDEDCGGEDEGGSVKDASGSRRSVADGWYRSQKEVGRYGALRDAHGAQGGVHLPPVHVQIILRGRRRVGASGVRYTSSTSSARETGRDHRASRPHAANRRGRGGGGGGGGGGWPGPGSPPRR